MRDRAPRRSRGWGSPGTSEHGWPNVELGLKLYRPGIALRLVIMCRGRRIGAVNSENPALVVGTGAFYGVAALLIADEAGGPRFGYPQRAGIPGRPAIGAEPVEYRDPLARLLIASCSSHPDGHKLDAARLWSTLDRLSPVTGPIPTRPERCDVAQVSTVRH
jgi:hypothetical protein